MIWRITIYGWRFTFTMAPISKVAGVNSKLKDDNHILMWDWDDTDFPTVRNELQRVQEIYQLPQIRIFESRAPEQLGQALEVKNGEHTWGGTHKKGNYLASCLKRTPWRKAVEIIAFTKGVCWGFLKFGVFREHFTSRVTPKCFRELKLVCVLKSDVPEDVSIYELRSWVKYDTIRDGYRLSKKELTIP